MNANFVGKSKLIDGKDDIVIISKEVLINAFHKMKLMFGESVICTLLYHMGKAIGLAMRDKYLPLLNNGNNTSDIAFVNIENILQKARDLGFIKISSINVESSILKVVVDYAMDEICTLQTSPFPLLRGLIDGLVGNMKASLIDVKKAGECIELYFYLHHRENLGW